MSVAASDPHWYAIRTRSRHEKTVHKQLVNRQIESFLPLTERWSRWKDRTVQIELPLFPGYCFARFPLAERLHVVTATGVAGLVGATAGPEPIPDVEIDGIRRLLETKLKYDRHPFLETGMEVEIIRGPFTGVRGRLIRKDQKTRLVLNVTLIRQAASVEIHPADVVPV